MIFLNIFFNPIKLNKNDENNKKLKLTKNYISKIK